MDKLRILFFIVLAGIILNSATIINAQENYISIIIPEEKETITNFKKYRLAANTLPNSTVKINGKKLKVYSSGAFVDLMNLEVGANIFEIESSNKGRRVSESFTIIREESKIISSSEDTLVIEDEMMLPSDDVWLDAGDILEVRIKGTPGARVSFLDGQPMTELPSSETNGIEGIYTGIYEVENEITFSDQKLVFVLEKDGERIEKSSIAKVSFLPQSLPRVGITITERPFLNYGLGTDRLGGAKLTFLEQGIKLAIDGKVGDQYRVRLSKNRTAWIPTEQVELLPIGTFLPKSLTESWAVYGGRKKEKVIIRLHEKLPWSTYQEVNPTRIIVDIYGATANTNWITQHLNMEEINNLYYEQVEEDVFRVVIEPVHKQLWGYDIGYNGNTLEIEVKKQPEILQFNKLKIVLDAGHGGENEGALGASGALEKDVNLDVVNRLETALKKKGAKVFKTRSDDTFSSNNTRVNIVNSFNADLLISIHANSIGYSTDPKRVRGTSTYYKHICYRPLSLSIYKRMLELELNPFGNIGNFNFMLNSMTNIPNVLVETAFMSHPTDEIKLLDGVFKEKMVNQIVQGIQDWLYECEDGLN